MRALTPFVQIAPIRPVDLRDADRHALETLPGIGPVLADRIVRDREVRGAFESVDALQRVRGVGPNLVEALAEKLIVSR